MNFLFTTVLVLLLVAPGLFAFRTYYAGRFSIRYSNLTISDQVFRSIVPGLLGQVGAFWLIQSLSSRQVRLDVLGTLLLGAKDDATVRAAFDLVREQLGEVLAYYLSLVVVGGLTGWGLRKLVRWRKWDRRYLWLRYDNQWHYLLTGEILETDELQGSIGVRDAKLMKLKKSNTLYSGVLVDYDLAADGGLRTLYLRGARRKALSILPGAEPAPGEAAATAPSAAIGIPATAESATTYYDVLGDLLVVPYAQILNLNLSYYVDEADLSPASDSLEAESVVFDVPSDSAGAAAAR